MAVLIVVKADGTEYEVGGTLDADAIHDNVAGEIAAITEKVTPVSADLFVVEDSAASNAKKRVQVGNLIQYLLLAGRAGGQTAQGGTAAGETLTLKGSAHATKGAVIVIGPATGGYTDYDLELGSANYGMIRMGNAAIGRTSYKSGAIDLDGAILVRNIGGPVTSEIEFIVVEATGGTCRLAIPRSAVGNATYHPRSMLIIGPAPADTDFVKVSYWQGLGWFHNLLCDTSGFGADLGVQNDLEVEGKIWVNEIEESTPAAGLKLQPGAGGDIELFGDTDVADAAGSKQLRLFRKAAEGDRYIAFYITQGMQAQFYTDADLIVQSTGYLYFKSGSYALIQLGDNAGVQKFIIRDSDSAEVGAWDSNGNITLDGTVDGRDVAADGALLDAHESRHMPGGADVLQVSATDRILGRDTAGAGDVEEIAPAAARTMLGLGTIATEAEADYFLADGSRALGGTFNTGTVLREFGNAGDPCLQLVTAPNATMYVQIISTTSLGPQVVAVGTNASLRLRKTGTGKVKVNNSGSDEEVATVVQVDALEAKAIAYAVALG